MPGRTKAEAESNGVEVGVDGNQKIDSMMHKPEAKSEAKEGISEAKENNTKEAAKREKEDDDGDQDQERPSKVAKKEEEKDVEGDAAKAEKPASKEQAATLNPGKEEEIEGEKEGLFKVLERGHIFFFYRPKVKPAGEVDKTGKAADSIDDVQNTHMLLLPQASDSSNAPAPSDAKEDNLNNQPSASTGEKAEKQGVGYRLIRLGKKRLPAPEEAMKTGAQPGGIGGDASEAIWACVSNIGPDVSKLIETMGENKYNTRTVGQRYVGPSRPVGRGWYAVTLQETDPPSSRSVKLVYALSHPSEMGDVQTELGLTSSGCVAMSMRNPTVSSGGQGGAIGLDDSAKVQMSKDELQETFGGDTKDGGTRWGRPEDVQILDREGVELLLTRERAQSNDDGASKGAGEDQADALKKLAEADSKRLTVEDVFAEISMSTSKHPPEAIQGDWI